MGKDLTIKQEEIAFNMQSDYEYLFLTSWKKHYSVEN